MKKKILGAALGRAVLVASTAPSAHMDVAIGLGVPGPVYAPAQCTHPCLPSCMLPHLSPSRTVVTTTGESANGANVASGVNVNGAAGNGVRTSGASVMIGAGIETTPEGATSEKSNLRVSSNES
ncbi:hypothetical protein OKW43_005736 [Paraburkholderia sp. WC7.3g]